MTNNNAFNKTTISTQLTEQIAIDIFDAIDSTNTYLLNKACNNEPSVCIAEQQTAGRGQHGRLWHSPKGKNIYLSLRYTFRPNIKPFSGLSLVMGLSLRSVIMKHCAIHQPLQLKWPNDLLCNHHKLAGILIETKPGQQQKTHAVIGIGLNVNMLTDSDNNITQHWTSLQLMTKQPQDRNALAAKMINQMLTDIALFSEEGLAPFLPDWKCADYYYHQPLQLTHNQQHIEGIGDGIDAHGRLKIKTGQGQVHAFSSGDITLLKSDCCATYGGSQ